MNWFTKSFVASKTNEQKKDLVEEHGGCDHVRQDSTILHVVSYENDSWGREGYCMCEACYKDLQDNEDNQTVVCHDCVQSVLKKDSISWKWYDFYAAQGDQPLTICNTCRTAPKHVERVKRDQEEYEEEMDGYRR